MFLGYGRHFVVIAHPYGIDLAGIVMDVADAFVLHEAFGVRVIGQLHGTFVLLEHPCGLLVMDQHTAHERVLFARLTEKADAGRVERQALLIPANVEVSAAEAPWVSERLDDLDRLGLRIEPFGPTTFIVREVPALLAHVDPSVLAREVIEALAGEAEVEMPQYVLAWTLAQPAMSSLVVGAKRFEQMRQAIAALDVRIPPEHFERLDAICPPPWTLGDPIRS